MNDNQKEIHDLIVALKQQKVNLELQKVNIELSIENQSKIVSDYVTTTKKAVVEIRDNTQKIKESISSYIKNESELIENEMNQYMVQYLGKDRRFLGYAIYDLTKIWSRLYLPDVDPEKPNKYVNKKDITEFDGLYVLTSDDNYVPDVDVFNPIREKGVGTNTKKETFFLVLEAKHSITNNDINTKIEQMRKFQDYIRKAKTNIPDATEEYKRKIKNYKLAQVDTKLILVFGSDNMGENQETKIKKEADTWKSEYDITVNYLKPCGEKYELYPYESNFKRKNLKYANVQSTSMTTKTFKIGAGKTKQTR